MENLFYYTGVVIWAAIALLAIAFVALFIWYRIIIKSTAYAWVGVMYCRMTTDLDKLDPIHKLAKQALEERLEALKKANIRKFEQKFLAEYLSKVPVKQSETVFS